MNARISHRTAAALLAGAAAVVCTACGGGQGTAAQTGPTAPTVVSGGSAVTGQAVDVLSAQGVQSVSVAAAGLPVATADGNGFFTLKAGTAGDYRSTVSGDGVVARETTIRIPGANATLSLIPRSFDLTAFDQMFRTTSKLQRWTSAPRLVVETRDLQFTTVTDSAFAAVDRTMSDAEAAGLVADLTWGLPQMTGNTYTAFASVTFDAPASGATVQAQQDGAIVVARYQGLSAATGFAGYGRWATRGDGAVSAGVMLLDSDQDRLTIAARRALRVHELGHALGYSHVLAEPSAMNADASLEPNDFDRSASRIAFQRTPGSQSPDVDPAAYRANTAAEGPLAWGPAIR